MARIKFGMMMTDARGKLGGQVFTKTRSGAAVRTKVTPVNPKTSSQSGVRARFGAFSQGWNNLTEEQRNAWNGGTVDYSKTNVFGDAYQMSGKNLYLMINQNLTTVLAEPLTLPPTSKESTSVVLTGATVDISSTGIELVIDTPTGVISGTYLVIEATAPLSPGKYNFDGKYRQIMTMPYTAGNPDQLEVWDAYVEKFGTPVLGKKISFRIYAIVDESGLASPRSTDSAIVQA